MKINQLRRNVSDTNSGQLLDETDAALDQALTYCRTLIARLSPAILFSQGLIAALHWLTEYFSKQGLRVHVQSHVDAVALPEDHSVVIFQSVRELLFNVLKHAGTDAATVETSGPDQGHFQITVVDNGKGFDMRTLSSTTRGYGLFSMQERIEGLGGTLTVNASLGSGTRIELLVPFPNQIEVQDVNTEAPGTVDTTPDSPKLCRVLVVDDHALIRRELSSLLASMEHVTVIGEACDGREGIELAHSLRPDLILMDINMPGMDGIEATRKILDRNPDIRIIGITINTDAAVHSSMMAAGAVASISKTRLPQDLGPTISRILDRSELSPSC